MTEESRVSYAAGLRRIADERSEYAERAAWWIKGDYPNAPDWPAIAARWREDAALCRALAEELQKIEEWHTKLNATDDFAPLAVSAEILDEGDQLLLALAAGFTITPPEAGADA